MAEDKLKNGKLSDDDLDAVAGGMNNSVLLGGETFMERQERERQEHLRQCGAIRDPWEIDPDPRKDPLFKTICRIYFKKAHTIA